ncbi:DUF934 domain-containing protein [Massilia sp. W12]|uniref:DUF934 domain-containing protein n=1 Tax=Massilia sp. W12 TaxID=3126507 RepID=UPI0030CC7FED
MPDSKQIILDQRVCADDWQLLKQEVSEEAAAGFAVPAGKVIVPLAVLVAQEAQLAPRIAAGEIGVWIASHERPETLRGKLDALPVVAVDFPKFADGRGYSIAYNLRTRLGFKGQLRAIGDVLRDQMFYMQRVGFNAFEPRADRNIHDALKGLSDFSEVYQNSVDQKYPLFARASRAAQAASQTQGQNFGAGEGI